MTDTDNISDGYHTFGELYEHRLALTVALTRTIPGNSWRSKQYHPDDGSMFDGYFIVGIELLTGTVTYHYRLPYWDLFDHVITLDHAPKYDGHLPKDCVERLLAWKPGEKRMRKL